MEIGGNFCLADINPADRADLSYEHFLKRCGAQSFMSMLSSGRTAYLNAWLNLKRRHPSLQGVLLPSYLCYSMLLPLSRAGVEARFYRVNADLSIDIDDLLRKARSGNVLVVVANYFGFPPSPSLLAAMSAIRQEGGALLYDATHSALCPEPWPATDPLPNVCVISLRKSLPVVDGAVSIWLDGSEPALAGGEWKHDAFYSARALAMMLKSSFILDNFGISSDHSLLFEQAEASLDSGFSPNTAMSPVSKSILKRVCVEDARQARRRNYSRLIMEFHGSDHIRMLFPALPEGAVPLGCPVVVENRDALWKRLESMGIHTDIHWDTPPEVSRNEFAGSAWLADRVLTLPCDQRYSPDDMTRLSQAVNGASGE